MKRAYFSTIIFLFVLSSIVLIPNSYTMVVRGSELDVKVGAYYYVWYAEGNGSRHWNDIPRNTVIDFPVLGYYSSQNETVIRQHLDWMKDVGLDFLIISWWGPNSYEDNSTKILFNVTSRYAGWMKLAVMVEGFSEGAGYNFTDIYEYLNTNYAVSYNNVYMKLNDKPLVCWFNFANMTIAGDNRLAIYNDSRFEARIVGQSYYVDWWFGTPWSKSDDFRPSVYRDKEICVEPRYDDSHSWGTNKSDEDYSLGLYDAEWNTAIAQAEQGNVEIVTIYSWNEFHERSQIEPSIDSTSYKPENTTLNLEKTRYYISQIKSKGSPYISPTPAALSESSYIVAKVGNFWVGQNGTSGNIDFNYTDASTTIQSCIDNLTSNLDGAKGGRILLRSGSSIDLTKQLVIRRPDITIEGEGWRSTGIVANFPGDIIKIYSGNETPSTPYTHCVRIKNLLFYNYYNLSQTAIYLNIENQPKLWYVDLEELYIINMNGIRTDHVSFGKQTNVLQGWIIRDVFIENAPQYGIDLWATIDMTIDNVQVNFAQNNETVPVENTTGIAITSLIGESSGIYITNTRVIRAEWGINITGVKDLWMTNVISDLCKTWAFKLDDAINCVLTNIYAHSLTGIGLLITGESSQNRIVGATVKDSAVGVKDNSTFPQYFDNVISESKVGTDWAVKSGDQFSNCNYPNPLQDLIGDLNISYISLNSSYNNLQTNFASLNSSYNDLKRNYDSLNSSYNYLNKTLYDYETSVQGQLDHTRNLVYVLIATTAIIAVAVVYSAVRKPKPKPET